mmetsp:Transcript_39709/g.81311  ORF Transcript_39709/g.81311 Transcript_39709/m.81311 type:complete len:349 (-) Transcript_39709:199-1245(-)
MNFRHTHAPAHYRLRKRRYRPYRCLVIFLSELLRLAELLGFLKAARGIHVLEEVEDRLRPPVEFHHWVSLPSPDTVCSHTSLQQQGAKGIARVVRVEPVPLLRQSLEGARRAVDSVLAHVRLARQAKLCPALVKDATEGFLSSSCRIGVTHHLFTKHFPGHVGGLPLHFEPPHRTARYQVLAAHGHVETVDDKDVLQPPTVEAAAKLHLANTHLQRVPMRAQFLGSPSQPALCLNGVAHPVLLQGIFPGYAEAFLELLLRLCRHMHVRGLLLQGFLRHAPIVDVDESPLSDLSRSDLALLDNLNVLLRQQLLQAGTGGGRVRVRLQHQEAVVLCIALHGIRKRVSPQP